MAIEMITIPKGGRPKISYTDDFLREIADRYKTMTRADIAVIYHVSVPTVARWIRIARDRGIIHYEHKKKCDE